MNTISNFDDSALPPPTVTGVQRVYYRLAKAAELTECSTEDLLHLGVLGRVQITAAVVAEDTYTWPSGFDYYSFPELTAPITWKFSASDRVRLTEADLSSIEAVGWVIPQSFYSPTHARQAIARAYHTFEYAVARQIEAFKLSHEASVQQKREIKARLELKADLDLEELKLLEHVSKPEVPYAARSEGEWLILREAGLNSIWRLEGPATGNEERTTTDHLFLSSDQLMQLLNDNHASAEKQVKRESKKVKRSDEPNGHVERHSKTKVEVLQAAIYCKANFPELCGDHGTTWAAAIDAKAHLFWLGDPPLATGTMALLLQETANAPEPRWPGKTRAKS